MGQRRVDTHQRQNDASRELEREVAHELDLPPACDTVQLLLDDFVDEPSPRQRAVRREHAAHELAEPRVVGWINKQNQPTQQLDCRRIGHRGGPTRCVDRTRPVVRIAAECAGVPRHLFRSLIGGDVPKVERRPVDRRLVSQARVNRPRVEVGVRY